MPTRKLIAVVYINNYSAVEELEDEVREFLKTSPVTWEPGPLVVVQGEEKESNIEYIQPLYRYEEVAK